jgi:photosystem II stability/assembly factor-like uncharacterized protein
MLIKRIILLLTILTPFTLYSQWVQMPAFPVGGTANDMYFININTGWITMYSPSNIIKTTDGGNSWVVQTAPATDFYDVQFFSDTEGVILAYSNLNKMILKTTNGGTNWNQIYSSATNNFLSMQFVNRDTGWTCGWDFTYAKIWITTDGGNTFNLQYSPGPGSYFTKIFLLKNKVNNHYWGWALISDLTLLRTTNSGENWTFIYQMESITMCGYSGIFADFYFKDTINGIATRDGGCFMLTTNGGYNWSFTKYNGSGQPNKIGMANEQLGWITLSNDTIIKTTNYFQTYGKQKHFAISGAGEIFVIDTSNAFTASYVFGKTTNGGGPFVSVKQISSEVPKEFRLYQNYPNPFNPSTKIDYEIPVTAYVDISIYDLLGRKVTTMVNGVQKPGIYQIIWDASNYSSGIYFYTLTTENFKDTKKLVYTK